MHICTESLYIILFKMEKPNSGLARTKSEQLVETVADAFKSPTSSEAVAVAAEGGSGTMSRKSSRRMLAASPGRGSGSGKGSAHIRKTRSAQMKFELDEVISSGAALSRASSASLGFSFSFTGFTVPADEIAGSKPFSDDDDFRKYSNR